MFVDVTSRHIDRGKRLSPCFCPIALAVKDYLRLNDIKASYVQISGVSMKISIPPRLDDSYMMNRDVQAWLDQFDNKQEVDPITLFVDKYDNGNGDVSIWR